MDSTREPPVAPETWLVAGARPTDAGDPLNVPLVPASTFRHGGEYGYARDEGTPTWAALEHLLAGLEGGRAIAFASGMAAVQAVVDQVPVGATIALPADCYQGVVSLVARGQSQGRWSVVRVPTADTSAWLEVVDRADLVWLESPSNPLLEIADLAQIAGAQRRPGSIMAVDNTFATPLNQRPLDLGADVSVQSVTKLIGGHSDLLGGVATVRQGWLYDALHRHRVLAGATPGAMETYLAVRGARTLALRLERAQANALELANRLARHSTVERVRYPGLPSHPGHEIAAVQWASGFGSLVAFEVAGGAAPADEVCRRVRLIRHATSLGSVESTMERRAGLAGQSHVPAGLIRLSVGIEDVDDLWRDLEQALGE